MLRDMKPAIHEPTITRRELFLQSKAALADANSSHLLRKDCFSQTRWILNANDPSSYSTSLSTISIEATYCTTRSHHLGSGPGNSNRPKKSKSTGWPALKL